MNRTIYACGAFSPASNFYWATWSLLTACNYTCRYCPIRDYEYANDDTIRDTMFALSRIADKKKLEVTLFGGEPTIHPKYFGICKELSRFANVRTFTNFTDKVSLYNTAFFKYGVTYSISYHPDMIKSSDFCRKINELEDLSCIGHINIMFVPDCDHDVWGVAAYCRENHIPHRISPVCELGNLSAYIKSISYSKREDVIPVMDTYIVDNRGSGWVSDEECTVYNHNEFYGYRCWKWKTSCFIDHKGYVYGCLRDIPCMNSVHVTNFRIEDMDITICPYDSCICENYLPKELVEGYADRYLKGVER